MKEYTAERAILMIILGAVLSLSCDSASLKKKIDELAANRAPAAGALLDHLCETLILGKLGGLYQGGEKRNITYAGYTAVLRLDRDGKKEAWVLTAFGPKDFKGDREKVKKKEALVERRTCLRILRLLPHTYRSRVMRSV